eukprot:COSAG06_NODE_13768_length_1221_cov_4.504456_1_plen_57_part_01
MLDCIIIYIYYYLRRASACDSHKEHGEQCESPCGTETCAPSFPQRFFFDACPEPVLA